MGCETVCYPRTLWTKRWNARMTMRKVRSLWRRRYVYPTMMTLKRNGVGSVPLWHPAVTELNIEFTQLLKTLAPNGCQNILVCPPVKTNTLERSHALLYHGDWLSFLIELVGCALSRNPLPELGTWLSFFIQPVVTEL
jgi:hypothetical protein